MITDGLNPLNLLTFLALVVGSGAAVLLIVFSLVLKRPDAARLIGQVALGGVGVYLALFLIAALASKERVLDPSEEKHICEVDCHLAYSVVGTKTAKLLDGHTAHGVFYVVTVKIRFDETTISSHRGMAPLTPNSRYVAILDGQGRRYEGPTDALQRQLVPGESYTTDLAFDLPPDARDLRLILASHDVATAFIIGHENSFFHGKTTFRLSV
ncbi:MAG: hypothetical protein AUI99_01245 [Gemmatimonadetes bacterium 13_1_40CM_3_69_22]|nr:MAG: hypothetical protein AUI99_01245 [Gemmatimonadetes bacterium 13_1_40CM_3_69_22]OLD95217.1 MAG: hypothetical protein AUG79_05940 [Gemmatimonadetes bacterium 13_1_20CM_4_69_16]PYO14416.1 MAG: hypothetical protein DMD31_09475 [Gemmatimonadota bacterium]